VVVGGGRTTTRRPLDRWIPTSFSIDHASRVDISRCHGFISPCFHIDPTDK
jgi:hypothetical protein